MSAPSTMPCVLRTAFHVSRQNVVHASVTLAGPAPPKSANRMSNLRFLVWAGIPARSHQLVMSLCPRILVNPPPSSSTSRADGNTTSSPSQPSSSSASGPYSSSADWPTGFRVSHLAGSRASGQPSSGATVASGGHRGLATPAEADGTVALDEPLAQLVGSAAWEDIGEVPFAPPEDLPLHEKFRRALVDRERTVRVREQKSQEVWQRRQLRTDVVLRMTEMWLDQEE